ncbi:hypothetical protein AX769_13920 [Frondihabitans sp. PAMC 28766]|nr:hypothetical protein AX769_13920 [Frondihabitans sp. PAMC 28766]
MVILTLTAGTLTLLATGCASAKSPESSATASLSAHDLSGASYKSTGGTDKSDNVSWLQSKPLKLAFTEQNGVLTAVLNTPCNTVNVPVDVQGRSLVPDTTRMASTAMSCAGEAGSQEQWATAFISKDMTVSRGAGTLTLLTDDAEIDFES